MWGWLNDNSGAIRPIAGVATLGIRAVYLQMLFSSYREGRRAKFPITPGGTPTFDGHCLVANMSAKAIFVDAVLLDLTVSTEQNEKHFSYSPSNLTFDNNGSDPRAKLFQGPLDAAEDIDLGSFRTLITRMSPPRFDHLETIENIRITIVATYTSEDSPVAAERIFDIIGEQSKLVVSPRISYAAKKPASAFAARCRASIAARDAVTPKWLGRHRPNDKCGKTPSFGSSLPPAIARSAHCTNFFSFFVKKGLANHLSICINPLTLQRPRGANVPW